MALFDANFLLLMLEPGVDVPIDTANAGGGYNLVDQQSLGDEKA
jgi:hypothetical protein